MCGIFACFLNRPLEPKDMEICRSGRDALKHRGPDDEGEWFDEKAGVFLGHARLSILDLTRASAQPMQRDGSVIAYNGEIYNFEGLRDDLRGRGVSFQSRGDTEVLLRGWETWGEGVLNRVDGMFAFAIWDGKCAHLCVDPFGEKTLYWAETPDGIFVSSELTPLTRVLGSKPDLSGEVLAAYLALGYVPAPHTAFPKVFRMPAASVLTIRNGKVSGRRKYWDLPFGEMGRGVVRPLGRKEEDQILEVLTTSLRGRLLADVPLCLFLSSGVDSPLVAAIAKKELGISLRCLTVSFPRGNVVNEAPQARKIARYLGLDFEEVESNEDPSEAGAQTVLDFFGQPCSNITVVSCYQVSRAAASKYKVAVTGMGGDEVFYGYDKHSFFYRFRHLYSIPAKLRRAMARVTALPVFRKSRIGHFAPLLGIDDREVYLANKNYPCISWFRRLPPYRTWVNREFDGFGKVPALEVPAYEISQVMQNTHLPALDLGSMRASLELRTPYLSRRLVETIARFDPRVFLAFGQKVVLRNLLSRYIPADTFQRSKVGFVFPRDQFLSHYGEAMPCVPGLPEEAVRLAWAKRAEGRGWNQLAVRLVLASKFMENPTGSAIV